MRPSFRIRNFNRNFRRDRIKAEDFTSIPREEPKPKPIKKILTKEELAKQREAARKKAEDQVKTIAKMICFSKESAGSMFAAHTHQWWLTLGLYTKNRQLVLNLYQRDRYGQRRIHIPLAVLFKWVKELEARGYNGLSNYSKYKKRNMCYFDRYGLRTEYLQYLKENEGGASTHRQGKKKKRS